MTTFLLPDETYGDEFLNNLKSTMRRNDDRRNTINNLYRKTKANEMKNRNKAKKVARCKGPRVNLAPKFNMPLKHESSDSENDCRLRFDDGSANDYLSGCSFTSESEEDEKLVSQTRIIKDGYSQEMSRLLKGIRVWETVTSGAGDRVDNNNIIWKHTTHRVGGGGCESSENKKAMNHKRSTSLDAFRARQQTKHFLSKHNIGPEFFCQHKSLVG